MVGAAGFNSERHAHEFGPLGHFMKESLPNSLTMLSFVGALRVADPRIICFDRRMKSQISFVVAVLLFYVHFANAATGISSEQVDIRLIAGAASNAEKSARQIGVSFRIKPEWHVYWRNPGDSGSAPKFAWTSEELQVGEPQWPLPKRFFVGDLVNLGYEDEVVILFDVKNKNGTSPVAGKLVLDLEWLVCKVECIPGFAKLDLTVGADPTKADENLLQSFASLLPRDFPHTPVLKTIGATPDGLEVQTASEGIEFFAVDGEVLAPKPARAGVDGVYTLPWAENRSKSPSSTPVLLAWMSDDGVRSNIVEVSLQPARGFTADDLMLLLFAVLGGLILNLMPCVFPVLSIKILSMVDSVGGDSHRMRTNGWAYTIGVVLTFAMLGGVLLGLRAAGQQIGWGFQLQSPWIVAAMAFLFFIVSLNFLGLFEMGESIMNSAGRIDSKGSHASASFWTGVLSVFVAAPCTGPFMGSALGAAVVLPPWAGLAIFVGLGVGMALPFLLLAYFPAWTKKLPRPGKWMETLRQFFAFPLLATVIWLLWVLQMQTSGDAVVTVLSGLLALAFLLWWAGKVRHKILRAVLGLLMIASVIWPLYGLYGGAKIEKVQESKSAWSPYNEKAIQQALGEGRAVFIDFTAAWCVTCQWNKKSVLDTKEIQDLFAAKNVFLVRADWTDRDEDITKALAAHGRASVPLYLYQVADSKPRILPQLLTTSMIHELFQNQ